MTEIKQEFLVTAEEIIKASRTWTALYSVKNKNPPPSSIYWSETSNWSSFRNFLGVKEATLWKWVNDGRIVVDERIYHKIKMLCSPNAKFLMKVFIARTGYQKKL